MKKNFRAMLALGAAATLTIGLSACGPDDDHPKVLAGLADPSLQPDWSLNELASVSPQYLADAPLPRALPMQAAYDESYGTAPAFDYAPQDPGGTYVPIDRSYYASDDSSGDYALLALASSLGAMLGNAPPDYAFAYDGVQPWAWRTGDGYRRYAEPVPGGYRYYYYQPRADRPFLVRDPYYSYGYRDGRLAAMYDRDGRLLDWRRLQRQQQAANDYLTRAERLYRAAERDRFGVSAPLWERNRAELAREQRQWEQARRERAAWRQWETANEQPLKRDWVGEALVRREAERDFAGWQKANFSTPAPAFYTQQQRRAQLQRLAEVRREQAERAQLARREAQSREVAQRQKAQAQQLAQQRQALAERNAQQQVAAERLRTQRERQQAEAGRIPQQNARLVQQRQSAAVNAQHAQAKLLAERRAAQAKVAEARRAQAAAERQAHQAELAKAQQARIATAREAQVAKARQAQVAKAREAQIAKLREAQVAKAREAGLAKARQAQQAKLANAEGASSARAKQAQQAKAKVKQAREAAAQANDDAKPNAKPIWAHRRDRG